MKKLFLLILLSLNLLSCSSVQVENYKNEAPVLQLDQYLNGTIDAYGIVQDRKGLIIQRFHCLIEASWKNNTGTLNEKFTYSDGRTSQRIWTLQKVSEHEYIGTAADVVGQATGQIAGNTLRWKYVLAVPVGDSVYNINFDDWMYLMDQKIMINKTKMTKFGFDVGEVTLTFVKR